MLMMVSNSHWHARVKFWGILLTAPKMSRCREHLKGCQLSSPWIFVCMSWIADAAFPTLLFLRTLSVKDTPESELVESRGIWNWLYEFTGSLILNGICHHSCLKFDPKWSPSPFFSNLKIDMLSSIWYKLLISAQNLWVISWKFSWNSMITAVKY